MAAREAGKTSFIGFTGHKDPHIHLYTLELARKNNFQFDTVQMPVNVMDAHFRSFAKLVIPEAQKMGLGVLGMKSMGSSVILKSNTATPVECLRYSLSQPVAAVITGIDSQQVLDQDVQLATEFQPLTQQETAAILQKTAMAAAEGKYELFKTTSHFDSTAQHPEWLAGDYASSTVGKNSSRARPVRFSAGQHGLFRQRVYIVKEFYRWDGK